MAIFTDFFRFIDPHLFIAAALGACIGLEREISGKDPSLRTFALISLGSCIFTLVSVQIVSGAPHADPSRIAAQVVTGIGFLGAGAIFRSETRVNGLTTAALMWCTSALGVAVGADRIDLALSATIVALFCTFGLRIVHKVIRLLRGEENQRSVAAAPLD
jgi:putative Mg2+ transporter-C (MgtC) family protein